MGYLNQKGRVKYRLHTIVLETGYDEGQPF
jgi:hypothetical protein